MYVKIIAFLIVISMFFTGCSSDIATQESADKLENNSQSASSTVEVEDKDEIIKQEQISKAISGEGYFLTTLEEIMELALESELSFYPPFSSDLEDFSATVHIWNKGVANIRIIGFQDAEDNLYAISFSSDDFRTKRTQEAFSKALAGTLTELLGFTNKEWEEQLLPSLNNKETITKNGIIVQVNNDSEYEYHYIIYPETQKKHSELFEASIALPQDLLANEEENQTIQNLSKQYHFQKILDLSNDYLEKHPESMGNAFVYKSILTNDENIMDYFNSSIIDHDEIENTASVYYKGAEEINRETHLISNIYKDKISVWAGTIENNWIFFDKIIISCDGETITKYIASIDLVTDVISGNELLEKTKIDFYDEQLDLLMNAEKVTIRFENSKEEKHVDYEITENELSSIIAMIELRETYIDLSNWTFKNKQEHYPDN